MRVDFHYYAVYTLARLAGIDHKYAKILSYSSQHVDDAKYDDDIEFDNGGKCRQLKSAHQFYDPDNFEDLDMLNVYMPFHFLPGCSGDTFKEKLICQTNSPAVDLLVTDVLRTADHPYGLHRIGVALHVIADTWAHQGFTAVGSRFNDIAKLSLIDGKKPLAETFFDKCCSKLADRTPAIGHAQAFTYPDAPDVKWAYKDHDSHDVIADNRNRYMEASKFIFDMFDKTMRDNSYLRSKIYSSDRVEFEKYESIFKHTLFSSGDTEERVNEWIRAIEDGVFGFTQKDDFIYKDREWFKAAIEIEPPQGKGHFEWKEHFGSSDWKLFQDALQMHKFFVQNDLLPRFEIYT